MCRAGDDHGKAWRRIAVLSDGRIAGAFNLNDIRRGLEFDADANWWISADQVGQGLGAEGLRAVLDFALADLPRGLGLQRVHAAIMPSNCASIRLARHVGLRQGGGKASIRLCDRWVLHEIYERTARVSFAEQSVA
jgi:RimJ/RimL family protein N-acetyltransferase